MREPPAVAAWDERTARRPPTVMPKAAGLLYVLAIAIIFSASGGVLWLIGFNYDGLSGSPLTKIHPGTYLVVFIVLWTALAAGNPVAFVVDVARRRPACLLLLLAGFVVFLHIVARSAPGMAGTIDTYLAPPLAVILFTKSDEPTRAKIEIIVHVVMFANAMTGLVEFGTRQLFFPYRFDGAVYPSDLRSTALQGHPLSNATVTAVYVLALLAGGGGLSVIPRATMIVLQLMAMVAFGGRSAIVTVAVLGGLHGLVVIHRIARSGRIPLLGMAAAALLLTLTPIAIAGLSVGGFFDALLMRFTTDGGSANARVEMLNILSSVPPRDLIFGPDIGLVESLRREYGLELGIENPIVYLILYQGALVTAFLFVAIGFFLAEIVRWSRRGILLPLLGFLIILNTFESIASKTTALAKFAVMMLVLFRAATAGRQPGMVSPSAARTGGSNARVASSITPMLSKRFQNAHGNPRASAASRTSRM